MLSGMRCGCYRKWVLIGRRNSYARGPALNHLLVDLDGDDGQDVAYLGAGEGQGDHRDEDDQRDDQGVLGQALAPTCRPRDVLQVPMMLFDRPRRLMSGA